MCGISVIIRHCREEGQSLESYHDRTRLRDQMQASLDTIKHRGPDSSGIWISKDNRIVLGHNRLAINDLSNGGHQPLHSVDDTIHAVVNGELYDHERIRARLTAESGYQFTGTSDSEIVIALYQAHGLDFLQHLRGEFAICLYDEAKDMFIAARDRYGIKPLFYTRQEGRLLIAAEIKAFLPLDWQAEWDVQSIVESGWNFDERTLFRDVRKLRPGHYMACDSFGHIEQHSYWDIDYPDKHIPDGRAQDELIQGVRSRLIEAVNVRLRADVPIGIYLSGGIDSSVIAGVVTHLAKEQGRNLGSQPAEERISCFSISFDKESGFDESDIAERTAEWLGVKLHKKIMDEEALAARFEDATWHCEHHNPDLNYVGKYALSELTQESGYKVVLTGEGADEIFTGYGVYLPDVLRERDLAWKATLPEADRIRLLEASEAERIAYYKSIGAGSDSQSVSEGRRRLNDIVTVDSMAAFVPPVFEEWASSLQSKDPQDVVADDIPPETLDKIQQNWHPANTAQYVWTKNHLPNIMLSCLGDRTEMAHSIEGRTPFLDHHLTEYVDYIPPSLKMRWKGTSGVVNSPVAPTHQSDQFTAKWILREAMKPFVTREIYERVKHPYTAPLQYKYDGPMHRLLSMLVTEDNVRQLGFVSWEKVSDLLRRAFEDRQSSAFRLALCVAQWIVLAQRFNIKTAEA